MKRIKNMIKRFGSFSLWDMGPKVVGFALGLALFDLIKALVS